MTLPTNTSPIEGRAAAVRATRERIAQAALELFVAEPYEAVTLTALARAADVSHQTLLNHFGSKDGLMLAAAGAFSARVEAARGPVEAGDVEGAVAALMRQYEALGEANLRFAAQEERSAAMRESLQIGRAAHTLWLETVFGASLPATGADRRRVIAALYVATDVHSWRLLRHELGLSRSATAAVMTDLIRCLTTKEES